MIVLHLFHCIQLVASNAAVFGLLLKVGRGRGTWGPWDSGTWGRGDVGTRGLRDAGRDAGTWYARTSELGDARGFEDVINK